MRQKRKMAVLVLFITAFFILMESSANGMEYSLFFSPVPTSQYGYTQENVYIRLEPKMPGTGRDGYIISQHGKCYFLREDRALKLDRGKRYDIWAARAYWLKNGRLAVGYFRSIPACKVGPPGELRFLKELDFSKIPKPIFLVHPEIMAFPEENTYWISPPEAEPFLCFYKYVYSPRPTHGLESKVIRDYDKSPVFHIEDEYAIVHVSFGICDGDREIISDSTKITGINKSEEEEY